MATELTKTLDSKVTTLTLKFKDAKINKDRECFQTPICLSHGDCKNVNASELVLNLSAETSIDDTKGNIQTLRLDIKPKKTRDKTNSVASKISLWVANAEEKNIAKDGKYIADQYSTQEGDVGIQCDKNQSFTFKSGFMPRIHHLDASRASEHQERFKTAQGNEFRTWKPRGNAEWTGFNNDEQPDVLQVRYPHMYCQDAWVFKKAECLGGFSIDGVGTFGNDKSFISSFDRQYLPRFGRMSVDLDLNKGSDKYTSCKATGREKFQNVLKWILANKKSLCGASSDRLCVDFVSEIGNLNRIMRSPYGLPNWTMVAVEFQGTIYLKNWFNKNNTFFCAKTLENMEAISKWSYTFKHYLKGGDPDEGINVNEKYHRILKSLIGNHSLLYDPEVDCFDAMVAKDNSERMDAFVSVRCTRQITGRKMSLNYKRYKLKQWWIDNLLTGIPRMLVGYRDDAGFAHTVEMLKTDEMPELADGKWDASACLNFLEVFLDFVKERVKSNPGKALIIEYQERGDIQCKIFNRAPEMLPKWYTDALFA